MDELGHSVNKPSEVNEQWRQSECWDGMWWKVQEGDRGASHGAGVDEPDGRGLADDREMDVRWIHAVLVEQVLR